MIKSMTGFGRAEQLTDQYKLSVELKSVNHRYFDLSLKMPKKFNIFEASIRNLLKKYIQRGKVDLYISYEDYEGTPVLLKYNGHIARQYVEYCKQMQKDVGFTVNDLKISTLAQMPEVFTMEEVPEDEEKMWEILSYGLEKACEEFTHSRESEGQNLIKDLAEKLDYMSDLVSDIEGRAPQIIAKYRKNLETKVKELLETTAIDDNRIVQEVTIFADKVSIDEEVVRLKSHIEMTKATIRSEGSVGRKLDFIAQEMNREANTILSKSTDMEVADQAIALKTEIEKVREQIQNIE